MRISKRLRVISDFITDNSFILDIGCDHALLDIYTVLNKKNIKAIASDINEGPLKSAKENIKKHIVVCLFFNFPRTLHNFHLIICVSSFLPF